MITSIESLPPSQRFSLRFLVNGSVTVAFSHHAVKRIQQRSLDPEKILHSVSGVPISRWRTLGCPARYRKWQKIVVIFTCWKPKSAT